jgi:hypothetical protein
MGLFRLPDARRVLVVERSASVATAGQVRCLFVPLTKSVTILSQEAGSKGARLEVEIRKCPADSAPASSCQLQASALALDTGVIR